MNTEEKLEAKRTIFKTLLAQKKQVYERLQNYQKEILQSVNQADLDQSEMIEDQTENMMREMRIESKSLDHLKKEIDKLESYDSLAIFEYVASGTVVMTNDINYVVFSPERKFEVNGKSYYGISTDSPIYEIMKDHEAGDTIKMNEKEFTIEMVM